MDDRLLHFLLGWVVIDHLVDSPSCAETKWLAAALRP
jgi:hypothetical protein